MVLSYELPLATLCAFPYGKQNETKFHSHTQLRTIERFERESELTITSIETSGFVLLLVPRFSFEALEKIEKLASYDKVTLEI